MPWRIFDHVPAVKPCDFRRGIGCNTTLEEQPFAIVLLSNRGLLRESRRDAVNLSASENKTSHESGSVSAQNLLFAKALIIVPIELNRGKSTWKFRRCVTNVLHHVTDDFNRISETNNQRVSKLKGTRSHLSLTNRMLQVANARNMPKELVTMN